MVKKPVKIAVNGLGRIGKCIIRAYVERLRYGTCIKLMAINAGSPPIEDRLHSLTYDSTHGILQGITQVSATGFSIDNSSEHVEMLFQRNIGDLNWYGFDIDIVLECTGSFNKADLAVQHIYSGAKKVIISAPASGVDATIVLGANGHVLNASHSVISIGSCTTNCLAPVAKVLNEAVGIDSGFVTTVHAYTNDQVLLDARHDDRRRARAAALSIIPTTTGAAKAIGTVLPELSGKLDGIAIRVPVSNVSLLDLQFVARTNTSVEEIHQAISSAISYMPNILTASSKELVSIDFIRSAHSAIVDYTQTAVINKRFCRIVAWYDNEWGFANRMLDAAEFMWRVMHA